MPNLSLRDLDTSTLARIKSSARRRKLSVNRLIVETLQQHYAAGERANDDLDALAGSWSKAQAAQFNAAIAPFGEIDRALWAAEPVAVHKTASKKAASKTARRPASKSARRRNAK